MGISRLTTGSCAIGLSLIGLLLFTISIATAGHDGRERIIDPGLPIAAVLPALIGLVISLDWLLTGARFGVGQALLAPGEPGLRLRKMISAIIAVLVIPTALVALLGTSQFIFAQETHRRLARLEADRPAREARQSFPKLIDQLKSDDAAARIAAVEAIGALEASLSQEAVPALIPLLRDEDAVALVATRTLGKIGTYAEPAIPELMALLKRGSLNSSAASEMQGDPLRLGAAEALAQIPMYGPGALANALKDGNAEVRLCAVVALGRISRESDKHAAVTYLREAQNDQDSRVSGVARDSLERLDPQHSSSDLIHKLDVADRRERLNALWEIIRQGGEAKTAAPKLAELMLDPDPEIRVFAAHALVRADPESPRRIEALMLVLESPDGAIRRYAAESLGRLGAEAKAALPGLQRCMNEDKAHVRLAAAGAIWKISQKADDAVPALARVLAINDVSPGELMYALNTLSEIGPEAGAAIPAIEHIRDHGPASVRPYAKSALAQIQTGGASPQ